MTETNKSKINNILQKLEEKLINNEIDETIYNELKAKYEKQLKDIEKHKEDEKLIAETNFKNKDVQPKVSVKHHKMKYCNTCGTEISEKAEICPSCGIRLKKRRTGLKIIITLFILIAIASIVTFVWIEGETEKREAMQNVQITLNDVQVRGIGLTSATLDIYFNMYNPNSRTTATLDRLDYRIYANGNYLANGQISHRIDITPRSSKTVSTTVQVSYSGALGAVWSILTSGNQVNWNLKGTAHFETPFGTLNIPINQYI